MCELRKRPFAWAMMALGFLVLLQAPSAGAVAVLVPEEVEPGEVYAISISGQANETGLLTISGPRLVLAEINFTTDGRGLYEYRAKATDDEGVYRVSVLMNASGGWTGAFRVRAALCTTTNSPNCLGFLYPQMESLVVGAATLLAILVFVMHLPGLVAAVRRYEHEARLTGAPRAWEIAKSPFTKPWVLLHNARMTPATLPNERVALEMKRRERIDELIAVADYSRKFSYERLKALVAKTREVVEAFELERSVLKRDEMEKPKEPKITPIRRIG